MKKEILFMVLTIVLVLVITFSIGGTAWSKESGKGKTEKHYLAELEREYRLELRQILEENGYYNCGINMTKVIDESGNNSYTIVINHKMLSEISKENKEKLLEEFGMILFQEEKVAFLHYFL